MRDLAAVMVTVDRSPEPNYLVETLENLKRSDLLSSGRLTRMAIVDSGPGLGWALAAKGEAELFDVGVTGPPVALGPRCANLNVSTALHIGATIAPWVIFLEDDIDVCGRFFDSVGAWIDDYARDDRRLFPLGANYEEVQDRTLRGIPLWHYPIDLFYGTQAFAIRSEDAVDLSNYLRGHCYDRTHDGTAYDLLMTDWAKSRWPDIDRFTTPCPSFVQHIGRTSVIRPRPETHTFPSWPGREWSYADSSREEIAV